MWYSILQFLNIVGVVTNAFLVAFTSQYGRNWEGDPVAVVTEQLVNNTVNINFNGTINATVLLQTITEENSGRNRLWLAIGFEVTFLNYPDFLKFIKIAQHNDITTEGESFVDHF